jgi:3-methyl-2-oxobutanoate hydroxymethyltransferase
MVTCGYEDTTQISLDEFIYHCRSVARGTKTSFKVADVPFGTYEISVERGFETCVKLIQDGKMDAVKLEGGQEVVPLIERLTSFGIPVMGHVGLTPQRVTSFSGFAVQGKDSESAKSVFRQAKMIQDAGAFSIVLEAIPSPLAKFITDKLSIPTIGIGAGPHCSGQVLVQLDMLGGFDRFRPKFCKAFADMSRVAKMAIEEYGKEVKQGSFPQNGTHTYPMKKGEWELFQKEMEISDQSD